MALNREITTDESILAGSQASQEKRQRVLSLVDKLNREGAINGDMHRAADKLRDQIAQELPPSSGVSSYGANVRASEPSSKADRAGQRHTGYRVELDGTIRYAGGRKSRANERELEDALFAACGLYDIEHKRRVFVQHINLLIRIVTHTENMPTLTHVAKELDDYYTGAKQMPPFAVGTIQVWLGRLAMHYGFTK